MWRRESGAWQGSETGSRARLPGSETGSGAWLPGAEMGSRARLSGRPGEPGEVVHSSRGGDSSADLCVDVTAWNSTHACAHTCTHAHICTRSHTGAHTCTHSCTDTYAHAHTHMHRHIYTYVYVHTLTCTHTYVTLSRACADMHMCTRTHVHTHTHAKWLEPEQALWVARCQFPGFHTGCGDVGRSHRRGRGCGSVSPGYMFLFSCESVII